jgi:tetratricopeptide (TPR) repeat protein
MGIIRKRPSTAATPLWTIFETLQTDGIFISIILFISIAVYSNSLLNGFVYDDNLQVLENPWIKDIKNIPEIFTESVWSFEGKPVVSNYYRPMMHIIYMFNYHIFGLKPWGFHLINILLHASISILVFLIIKVILSGPAQSPRDSFPAFIAALLFATHPIHTEAVAWVAGAPELSYTFFFLLAFYLYMKSKEGFNRGYLFSIVSFGLATLCKEPAVTLPIILIAYDYAYRKDGDLFSGHIKRYIPYIIVSACYLLIRSYALGGFSPQEPHIKLTDYEYFINVFPLFCQYLEKLLLPLNLNAFHVLHPIKSIFQLKGILSLVITAAFVVLSAWALRKNKTVFLSFLLIAVPLLPVLYIPALGKNVFTERYLYLPSAGFVILIALVLWWTQANKPKLSLGLNIITILVIGLYSVGTISRNAVWKDDYTLFSDTAKKSPDSPSVRNNLGVAYAKKGQNDGAIREYQTALKLKPDFVDAYNNLGLAYADQGRTDEAINEYQKALKINPGLADAYNYLGLAYADQGRTDEAINEYQKALKINPGLADAYNNLGLAYAKQGRTDEAINEYRTALKLNTGHARAHNNLGLAYAKQGRTDEAINEYQTALKLNPGLARVHNNLGTAYKAKGKIDEAIKEYQIALRIKPDDADVHYNLGNAYGIQGRTDKAMNEYEASLKINPDHALAHNSLGIAYATQGRSDEAIKEFKAAIKLEPAHVDVHYNLGNAYETQGRIDEAVKEFKAVLKLNPDDVTARQRLDFLLKK